MFGYGELGLFKLITVLINKLLDKLTPAVKGAAKEEDTRKENKRVT